MSIRGEGNGAPQSRRHALPFWCWRSVATAFPRSTDRRKPASSSVRPRNGTTAGGAEYCSSSSVPSAGPVVVVT